MPVGAASGERIRELPACLILHTTAVTTGGGLGHHYVKKLALVTGMDCLWYRAMHPLPIKCYK
jgi:hypothetical protein